jgi:hypothetical protein
VAPRKKQAKPSRRLAELDALWRQLEQCRPFLRASVVVTRKRCIHEDCRLCRSGQKHPFSRLTIRRQGKTQTRYLPKHLIEKARRWVASYKRSKVLREQLSQLWLEELLDEHPGKGQ